MTEMHITHFHVLEAMAAVERKVGDRLGFGPARSLTQEMAVYLGAEAAVEAWATAKRDQPELEPRNDLEQLCSEFIALHDAEAASWAH
ncbi:hypothetical protein [Methylobacterium sp. PvR107]|uniref:hypothetical protein n=1 Tax=Methylobacterium sp. PvR107 TaxID=2806597 RepID=UPI001AE2031D|nr:hypothetical protein [Methylobacterium sp. PvR107]MBP1181426.1 hypothetical protein [Methylobacterium sp. PvR107]